MPRAANPKRDRECRELELKFRQEGRYPGREEEVAARIVDRQRSGDDAGDDGRAGQGGRTGTGYRRRNTVRRAKAS